MRYDHEFYYSQIKNILSSEPDKKITSIIFESGAQKKRLFGSGNADVAKPWLSQIYLDYPNYESSLKHEIAHIFSARFGVWPFQIPSSFNPGIIEGFAMALENNYDDQEIDYLAALAYKNDFRTDLSSLFNDFSFFSSASSISYIYAGSFIKYLSERFGWEKIKKLYSGEDFQSIFEKDITSLEIDYYEYLTKIKIDRNRHSSNYYFGYKPLIKRVCARATAKELQTARKLFLEKKTKQAAEKYLEIYRYSGYYVALAGYSKAARELGDRKEAVQILEKELNKFEGTSSYYYLEFVLADIYSLEGDSLKAHKYYSKIIEQNPHENYFRHANVNRYLLSLDKSKISDYLSKKNLRYEILREAISHLPHEFLFTQLIVTAQLEEKNYKDVLEFILQFDVITSFSSNFYFQLSQYSYKNVDFSKSLDIC